MTVGFMTQIPFFLPTFQGSTAHIFKKQTNHTKQNKTLQNGKLTNKERKNKPSNLKMKIILEGGESEYSMNRAFLKMQVWQPVIMHNGAEPYQEGPAENTWRTLSTLEVIKASLKDQKISRCTN